MLRTLWRPYNTFITQIGAAPADDQEARLRKSLLVGATLVFVPMGILWGALYVFFGALLAGAIPIAFAILTLLNITVFSLRRNYRWFSFSELLMILIFPFGLSLVLGGFANSGAVFAWSLLCPLGALLFTTSRAAIRWAVAYLALIELEALLEALLQIGNALPQSAQQTFFILNLGGVSLITFMLLNYFILQKSAAERMLRESNIMLERELGARKRAQEAVRKAEAEYRNLFEQVPIGIYRTTPDGKALLTNPTMLKMLGYTNFDEAATRNLEVEPAALYPRSEFKQRLEREGEIKGLEAAWRRQDQSLIYLRENTRAIRGADGTLLYYEGTVEDITARRQVEEALHASEKRFRALIENSSDVTALANRDGTLLYVSPSVLHVFGYTAEEIIGHNAFEYLHPDDQPFVAARLLELLEQPGRALTAIFRVRHKDGSWRWTEGDGRNLLSDPSIEAIVVNYRDITERREATEALQVSEARFRALTENSGDAVALIGADGVINYATRSTTRILGYSVEEFIGQNAFEHIHTDDLPHVGELFASILLQPGNHATGEFRFAHKDGSWRWIEGIGTNLLDEPNVKAIVANYRDVTKRKLAEQVVQSQNRFLAALHEMSLAFMNRLDLFDVVQRIVAQAAVLSGAQHGYCFLLDPNEEEMHMLVGTGFFRQRLGDSIRRGESAAGVVWETAQPLAVSHYSESSSRNAHPAFDQVRTLTAVPLMSNSKVIGVLGLAYLQDEVGGFRRHEDVQRLVQFGQLASIALDNAQLHTAVQHELIQRKQIEERLRASRQELRALSGRIQSAREEERTRISRELHDEMGQALTGLKYNLIWLMARADDIPDEEMRCAVRDKQDSMVQLIDSTIQSLRRIATELRPGVLDRLGLAAAIEWQMDEFQSHTGISCVLTSCPEHIELATDRATAVFRIFQELLTNVARHSHADSVSTSLETTAGELLLHLHDNGIGISESSILNEQSLGLLGMRERALLFGGDFNIRGVHGEGTTILVRIPIQPEETT